MAGRPDRNDFVAQVAEAKPNLRDFPFMPLDVARLLQSDTWIRAAADPKIGHALICLWAASWHQIPAASLPAADEILAPLAMCDPATWQRIKARVMEGWILWTDGRYYHPVVAEKALEAGRRKDLHRAQTEHARAVKMRNTLEKKQAHERHVAEIAEKRLRKRLAEQARREALCNRTVTDLSQLSDSGSNRGRDRDSRQGQGERKPKPPTARKVASAAPAQPDQLARLTGDPGGSTPSPQEAQIAPSLALIPPESLLPPWLDVKDWAAFVRHRKAIRKPLSEEAERRAIRKLDELRKAGYDPHKVIDATIVNGWSGLFAARDAATTVQPQQGTQQLPDPTKGFR